MINFSFSHEEKNSKSSWVMTTSCSSCFLLKFITYILYHNNCSYILLNYFVFLKTTQALLQCVSTEYDADNENPAVR